MKTTMKIAHPALALLTLLLAFWASDSSAQTQGAAPAGGEGELTAELHAAILAGDLDAVRALVSAGAPLEPSCDFNHNCKPLGYALFSSQWEIARYLVEAGADLNGIGAYGDPPLIKALERQGEPGGRDMAVFLVRAGANVNLPNHFGITPFTGTCGGNDLALIDLMLEHGARINEVYGGSVATETPSHTCLHLAVSDGNVSTVAALVARGADPDVEDGVGRSSRSIAAAQGDAALIEALEPE